MPRVSVHRANLEAGDPNVALVEWDNGDLEACREVYVVGTLRALPAPTAYGASVVIEATHVDVRR